MKITGLALAALQAAITVSATSNSAGVDVSDYTGEALLTLNSSATNGATATSDVKLQHSDNNSTWTDVPNAAFTTVTNAAASFQAKQINVDGLKKYVRVVNTLAGTTPAVTFSALLIGTKA